MGWQDGAPVEPPKQQAPAWMQGSAVDQIPTAAPVAPPVIPPTTILGDIDAGARNWQTRMRRGLVDTGSLLGGPILKKALGFMNPSDESLAAAAEAVKRGGPVADVTQMVGDIGSNLLLAPFKEAEIGATAATSILPKVAERLRMLAPELKQGAYNAAVVPQDDKLTAGTLGAAASPLAKAVAAPVTGVLKPFVTPEAKTLQAAGIELTPTMLTSGANKTGGGTFINTLLKTLRGTGKWLPGSGDAINLRSDKAISQLNVAKLNEILAPIGKNLDVNMHPTAALKEVDSIIDSTYDKAKAGLALNPRARLTDIPLHQPISGQAPELSGASASIPDTMMDIVEYYNHRDPYFSDREAKPLMRFIDNRIKPALQTAKDLGGELSGKTWKEIDSEMNKYSADALKKQDDPYKVAVGNAWKTIQDAWFAAAHDVIPGSKALMRKTDEVYAQLQPVEKVIEKPITGPWTPANLKVITERAGIKPTEFDEAARAVFSGVKPSGDSPTISATLGRGLAKFAGVGGTELMLPNLVPDNALPALAALGASTYISGSQPVAKYLQHGLSGTLGPGTTKLLSKALRRPMSYNDIATDAAIQNLTAQGIREYGRK